MITEVPEFLGRIGEVSSFVSNNLFGGCRGKYSYFRVSWLQESPEGDLLDAILEGEGLIEFVLMQAGGTMLPEGEYALVAPPSDPSAARIISNDSNDRYNKYGIHETLRLCCLAEYLRVVLHLEDKAVRLVTAIVKAHSKCDPSLVSHHADERVLYAESDPDFSLSSELAMLSQRLESEVSIDEASESDPAAPYSNCLAWAVSTCEGWGMSPEVVLLSNGDIAVCDESESDSVDWSTREAIASNEKVVLFEDACQIYSSFPDGDLKIYVAQGISCD